MFAVVTRSSLFCARACTNAFNNRRLARGAEMYDLVMAMRFERGQAKQEETWTTLCRLASAYRESDKVHRGGRRSWHGLKQAMGEIPQGYGKGGDGR